MKNKEIEELLNELKDKYSYEPYDNTGNVYTTISYEEGQLLLSYIEQLENNRDKAIEYNEHLIEHAKYHLNLGHLKKMRKILKGDSDDK